jgi:hypothetical protein
VLRRLDDGVHLGVQGTADLMPGPGGDIELIPHAAGVQAVGKPGRCAVVPGGEYPPISHDHRADLPTQAGGSLSYDFRYLEEVFVPTGSRALSRV